jgi:subtilisin family serine protease
LGLVTLVAVAMVGAGAFPAEAAGRRLTSKLWKKDRISRQIVVLNDSADARAVAAEHSRLHGAAVVDVFEHAVQGYVADVSESGAEELRRDARVRLVERDRRVTAFATQSNPPSWGVDRVDQRDLPLSKSFTYGRTGSGVTAYIIDTGIRTTHKEFAKPDGTSRARSGFDALGGNGKDCNGHGTHVAATTGGATFGVAKGVSLISVRVLDCSGYGFMSQVIAGVDWVTAHHASGKPAVANISLGGGASAALDAAVRRSINDGVSYVVAAGNNGGSLLGLNADACGISPARVSEAMTVGASDRTDRRASFSSYGSCVDWFAPGVEILSASNSSDTATKTMNGTSMAAPHTSGVAALYLQSQPAASPATVRTALFNLTTKGKVSSAKSSNNHLLFSNL